MANERQGNRKVDVRLSLDDLEIVQSAVTNGLASPQHQGSYTLMVRVQVALMLSAQVVQVALASPHHQGSYTLMVRVQVALVVSVQVAPQGSYTLLVSPLDSYAVENGLPHPPWKVTSAVRRSSVAR